MGRYFDTSSAVATVATSATKPADLDNASQKSQQSQPASLEKHEDVNSTELQDAFEERAAIMEYEAGMSRPEAERAAAKDVGLCPK